MSMEKELSRIARFVGDRVYDLREVRNQREIADIAGYSNSNMISMIKTGHTKVALDRVPALARALDCNVGELMRMALEQFFDKAVISDITSALTDLSQDETEVLNQWREAGKKPMNLATIAKFQECLAAL